MSYSKVKTTKFKNWTIAAFVALTLTVGCEKAVKPEMRNDTNEVEVKTLNSIVPIGDDDDERILIKPRVNLNSGEVAVGAKVTVSQSSFSTFGIVNTTNTLSLEVPSLGNYSYNIVYQGETVVSNNIIVDQQEVFRQDIID